ncbi:MAG TPA: PAS domain-containing protein [Deltaproteobacteria bacterium]|nr:PAS domain-containing protein [Deltaproteobacteria bacterium]
MELKDVIEQYRFILDHSFDELCIVDGNGTIIYMNATSQKHYGKDPSFFIGHPATRAQDEGFVDHAITPLVFKEKKKVTIIQKTNIGRQLLITGNPIFDESGNIMLIIENARDISEIRDLQKRLEETEELVKRYSEKLESLEKEQQSFMGMVIHSTKLKNIIEMIQRVALTDSTIMILGESGTGKDELAKIIHSSSRRNDRSFVKVNCGAIPSSLIESELFGYEGGAFTGSKKSGKMGLMESANGGTLFLDEITELPFDTQVKLLQALQDRKFIKVGGTRPVQTDFRLITATNRNINDFVKEGRFREDLFYRLYVVPIDVPPLRERKDEILPLLQYYINYYNKKYQDNKSLSFQAVSLLRHYDWPGNIRELKNMVERLVVTSTDDIISYKSVLSAFGHTGKLSYINNEKTLGELIEDFEKDIITQCYNELKSSYKVAARLGISQRTALRKINKHLGVNGSGNQKDRY